LIHLNGRGADQRKVSPTLPIQVSLLDRPAPAALPVEIVERKGPGHPDTICDASRRR
jgi:hypothetical protein